MDSNANKLYQINKEYEKHRNMLEMKTFRQKLVGLHIKSKMINRFENLIEADLNMKNYFHPIKGLMNTDQSGGKSNKEQSEEDDYSIQLDDVSQKSTSDDNESLSINLSVLETGKEQESDSPNEQVMSIKDNNYEIMEEKDYSIVEEYEP